MRPVEQWRGRWRHAARTHAPSTAGHRPRSGSIHEAAAGHDDVLVAPDGMADKSCRMPADNAPPRPLAAVIFDVDGVLIDSPHERAWREALQGITDPARLTTEIYQAHVAGK